MKNEQNLYDEIGARNRIWPKMADTFFQCIASTVLNVYWLVL